MEEKAPISRSLVSGLTGAAAVTFAHEVTRHLVDDAPRMDKVGMAAMSRGLRFLGVERPRGEVLRGATLLGDLVSNALYFAPVAARSKRPILRGALLGLAMGLGTLPFTKRSPRTKAIALGLYVFGGLAAGGMALFLRRLARPAETI